MRLAAAFAIGLGAIFVPNGPATAASPQLEESWRRCADSDADKSIDGCTEVIQSGEESDANLAAAYYNRAIAYRYKSQYLVSDFTNEVVRRAEIVDLAIQDGDQAIQLNPDDAQAYNNRGIAYVDKSQYDRAIQDYDRAIRLKPDYAEAYYNRGEAYRHRSRYDRAIQDDSPAIDRAIQDYDQAAQLKAGLAEPYNNRNLAYYKKGQYELALQDFSRTVRLNDNYGNLFVNRSMGASEAPTRRRGP